MDKAPRLGERKVRNGERRMNRSPIVKILTGGHPKIRRPSPEQHKAAPAHLIGTGEPGRLRCVHTVRGSPAGVSLRASRYLGGVGGGIGEPTGGNGTGDGAIEAAIGVPIGRHFLPAIVVGASAEPPLQRML